MFAAQCTQSRRREVEGSVTKPRELSTLNLPAYKVAKRRRLSKVAVNDYKSSSKAPYF